ncbi:MAG TPA: hypothetical protein VGM05_28485 [Planctomycetaceae bacterium]
MLLKKRLLDTSGPLSFDHLSGKQLIAEITSAYPFVFQRRDFGRKHEVGMARVVSYELAFHKLAHSLFQGIHILPILSKCFFVSTYDDAISEVTWTKKIFVKPVPGPEREIALTMSSGFKLDKAPDGWSLKPLIRQKTVLSEEFLQKRGWQFDVLPPFGQSVS